jgi:uncharacterized membrane protein
MQMNRSIQIIIAAILLLLLSLMNAASDLQFLLQGPEATAAEGLSYPLVVFNVGYNIVGVVAAIGLLLNMRWAKPVGITVAALSIVNQLYPVVLDSELEVPIKIISVVFALVYVAVIVLILRYNPDMVSSRG